MNRPEPIELENNLGPDAVTGEINRVPWMAYDVDEMDLYIAEKDKEIAELKKKLMPCLNGDCILTCEVVEKYGKENAELKQKLEEKDKEIAELKAALERDFVAKKSAEKVLRDLLDCGLIKEWFYNGTFHAVLKADDPHLQIAELKAEMVDAGMRERRLRRLLWHAIALFCARSCEYFSGIMSHCLMGQDDLYRRCEEKKNKYLNAMYKCRAKAEQYK